jgi:cadmium resistance protein CadD (predicted permease)
MGTNLDILVIENFFMEKGKQNKKNLNDYKSKYLLD